MTEKVCPECGRVAHSKSPTDAGTTRDRPEDYYCEQGHHFDTPDRGSASDQVGRTPTRGLAAELAAKEVDTDE